MARDGKKRRSKVEKESSLITPKFTARYAGQLLKPKKVGNSEPYYSVMVALPKSNQWWARLKKALDQALLDKFDKTSKQLKIRDWPIKDGDKMDLEEVRGLYVIRPKTYERPGFIDANGDELDPTSQEIYSGMICRVSVRPWAWYYTDTNARGVSLFLNNVCKIEDGTRISGRPSAAEDFGRFLDEGEDDEEEEAFDSALDDEGDDDDEIPF